MYKRGGIGFLSLFIINPLVIISFQNFTIAKDNITTKMTQMPLSKSNRSPASVSAAFDSFSSKPESCPAPKRYESVIE